MEAKYGGSDPVKWLWGPGGSLTNVHEADEALCRYRGLSTKLAELRADYPTTSGSSSSTAPRERSRSPR